MILKKGEGRLEGQFFGPPGTATVIAFGHWSHGFHGFHALRGSASRCPSSPARTVRDVGGFSVRGSRSGLHLVDALVGSNPTNALWVTTVLAVASLAIYGAVAFGASRPKTVVFVIVAPASWLLPAIVVATAGVRIAAVFLQGQIGRESSFEPVILASQGGFSHPLRA